MERKYMMNEGADGNEINLLVETPTTEGNGVKIIIPVSYGDRRTFIDKMKEQLAYFEDIYFNVDEIGNEFKILREEDFQVSDLVSDNCMHICLDNVYYPIDFKELGINHIYVPVGLRFGLTDGIFPTPNRESIRYTQEAKKVILEKIGKVADYFVSKYNSTIKDTDSLREICEYYNSSRRSVYIDNNPYEIAELASLSKVKFVTPKLNGVTKLNLARIARMIDTVRGEYETSFMMRYGKLRKATSYYDRNVPTERPVYIYSNRLGGVMKEYLKSQVFHDSEVIARKVRNYTLFPSKGAQGDLHSYYEILELRKYPKSEWRDLIKEFQYIQSLSMKNFVDIDSIQIPEDWLAKRRKEKVVILTAKGKVPRPKKLKGDVIGKRAENLERYVQDKYCKFVPVTYQIEKIATFNRMLVYTSHDNSEALNKLYPIFAKQKVEFITFSDRELKVLSNAEIHNLIPLEKFMEGKTKPFKRIVTAYLIHQLIEKYHSTFNRTNIIREVSTPLADKLDQLYTYRETHKSGSVGASFYDAVIAIADEYKLYDESIYPLYLEIKATLEGLPFIEPMVNSMSSRYGAYYTPSEGLMNAFKDLFRFYKFRMNIDAYPKPIIEEETTQN